MTLVWVLCNSRQKPVMVYDLSVTAHRATAADDTRSETNQAPTGWIFLWLGHKILLALNSAQDVSSQNYSSWTLCNSLSLNQVVCLQVGYACLMMYGMFLVLATLIELNVFFTVNLPTCGRSWKTVFRSIHSSILSFSTHLIDSEILVVYYIFFGHNMFQFTNRMYFFKDIDPSQNNSYWVNMLCNNLF